MLLSKRRGPLHLSDVLRIKLPTLWLHEENVYYWSWLLKLMLFFSLFLFLPTGMIAAKRIALRSRRLQWVHRLPILKKWRNSVWLSFFVPPPLYPPGKECQKLHSLNSFDAYKLLLELYCNNVYLFTKNSDNNNWICTYLLARTTPIMFPGPSTSPRRKRLMKVFPIMYETLITIYK